MPIALKALIENVVGCEDLIGNLLNDFSCKEDEDIESFLKNKAIKYEKLAKARTYLIVDMDEIDNTSLEIQHMTVYGFISVTLGILRVSEETSKSMRKKLDGLAAWKNGVLISEFPCYLIGQLSRNSNIENNELTGQELIDIACDIIRDAFDIVGGRNILIECRNNEKLIGFYERNDFKEISSPPQAGNALVQMIRRIQ